MQEQRGCMRRIQKDLTDSRMRLLSDGSCDFVVGGWESLSLRVQITPLEGEFRHKQIKVCQYCYKKFPADYPFVPPSIVRTDQNQKIYLQLADSQHWMPTYGLFELFWELREAFMRGMEPSEDELTDEEGVEFEANDNFVQNFELDEEQSCFSGYSNHIDEEMDQGYDTENESDSKHRQCVMVDIVTTKSKKRYIDS